MPTQPGYLRSLHETSVWSAVGFEPRPAVYEIAVLMSANVRGCSPQVAVMVAVNACSTAPIILVRTMRNVYDGVMGK